MLLWPMNNAKNTWRSCTIKLEFIYTLKFGQFGVRQWCIFCLQRALSLSLNQLVTKKSTLPPWICLWKELGWSNTKHPLYVQELTLPCASKAILLNSYLPISMESVDRQVDHMADATPTNSTCENWSRVLNQARVSVHLRIFLYHTILNLDTLMWVVLDNMSAKELFLYVQW